MCKNKWYIIGIKVLDKIFMGRGGKMFYNCDNPVTELISVDHLRWSAEKHFVKARPYSALAFRVKGRAEITSNGKKHLLDSGDLLYLPEGLEYTVTYSTTDLIVIHFRTLLKDSDIEVWSTGEAEEIYKLFLKAHLLWNKKEAGFTGQILSTLYKILAVTCKNDMKNLLPKNFSEAVSELNSSFGDSSLSISAVCRNAGVGEGTFRRLFKKYYGRTPVDYLTDLRVSYAREHIAAGTSVEQAAAMSGFSDPKYFARVVKAKLGCTPRELKNYGK